MLKYFSNPMRFKLKNTGGEKMRISNFSGDIFSFDWVKRVYDPTKCPYIRFRPAVEKNSSFSSQPIFLKCLCNYADRLVKRIDGERFQAAYGLTIKEIEEKGEAMGNYDWLTDIVISKWWIREEIEFPNWCPIKKYREYKYNSILVDDAIMIEHCNMCKYLGLRRAEKWLDVDESFHDEYEGLIEYFPPDKDIKSILPTSCFCYKEDRRHGKLITNLTFDRWIFAKSWLTAETIKKKKVEGAFNWEKDVLHIINPIDEITAVVPVPNIEIPEWCPLPKTLGGRS